MSSSTPPPRSSPLTRTSPPPRILVAGGGMDALEEIASLLRTQGYRVDLAASREEARESLLTVQYEAALIDASCLAKLPETQGTAAGLLDEVTGQDKQIGIIVLTPPEQLASVSEWMQRGARNFLQKPWKDPRLLFSIVRTQIELCRALREVERLNAEQQLLSHCDWPMWVAHSAAMDTVIERVPWIARSRDNVMILGEHGTGKREIAKILHLLSPQRNGPFLVLEADVLARLTPDSERPRLQEQSIETSDLGSLRIHEWVEEGTLFLPAADRLTPLQQAAIHRLFGMASQYGRPVNFRVISSTVSDLERQPGEFRQDLLAVLARTRLHLPALRDRKEEIPELTSHFLRLFSEMFHRRLLTFSAPTMQLLMQYDWPGNIRELQYVVERAVLASRTEHIEVEDLALKKPGRAQRSPETLSLSTLQKALIQKALDRFGGDIGQAAEALKLSRGVLCRKIQRYKL